MLAIPAIDLLDNSVVRLEKGLYESSKKYEFTPIEMAMKYNDLGFEWLHVVDLQGSKEGRIGTKEILSEIKEKTKLKIEFGGGIRSVDQIINLTDNLVDRVILGSISVTQKDDVLKASKIVGNDKIVIASDVLNNKIKIKGWTEETAVNIFDHVGFYLSKGIQTFLCTDISKDGMLSGPGFDLYHELQNKFPEMKLIASGGISSMNDILYLNEMNCYAAVVGKSIYENKIDLKELSKFGS